MAKGTKKTNAPKKDRKVRAKMRTRKESPAGHFADRLAANMKQREDIMRAVSGYPNVDPTVQSAHDVCLTLNRLAASGFVPARKKPGARGATFAVGQQVSLSDEAKALLKTQCPKVEVIDTFVGEGYDGGKTVPIRGGGSTLDDLWIGFVAKKWIAPITVA